MKLRDLVIFAGALSLSMAFAQAANSQAAPTPWSIHDAVGAPDSLTLRASARTRLESIKGQPRPGFNDGDTLLEVRTTLFAEYQTGPLRFGGEVYDSRAYGGDLKTPIGVNEVNVAEVVQAYAALDLEAPFGPGTKAIVQVGRLALSAGSRRLVSTEEWRNTTNSYFGLRGDLTLPEGLTATAFHVQPVVRLPDDRPSLLDNAYKPDRESDALVLWGGLVSKARFAGQATVEASFYRFEERDSAGRPTRDRRLDTFGGRIYRGPSLGQPDYEVEAFSQTGEISRSLSPDASTQRVSAWFFHMDVGYTFATALKPRISLRYDQISGDKGGSRYGRFDTLFGMRGAEFAPSGIYNTVGRANLISPAVVLELTPDERSDLYLRYRPLWLESRTDSFSTSNVRDATGRSGNFAGNQVEARWRRWLVPDALRFELNAVWLAKGRFLREAPNSPRARDTGYGAFNLTAFF